MCVCVCVSTLFQIQYIIESFNDCLSTPPPCSWATAHSYQAFVNQCEEATSLITRKRGCKPVV